MEPHFIDTASIPWWGIDADPADKPNYPIKHYTGDDHQRKNWMRPKLQPLKKEILRSTERPFHSAVFGTSLPPRRLNGSMRRLAFTYSENMYRHWLLLLLADRMDVLGNNVADIFRGNWRFAKERGWYALGKHKPWLVAWKIFFRLLILGLLVWLAVCLVR